MPEQKQTEPNKAMEPAKPKQPLKKIEPGARIKFLITEESIKKRFEDVLGKRAPGFISSIISATNSNKALAECEPMSVIAAAMIAASMDLPINQSLGFAHIVPYKGVAQFQIGWKGFVQLAMRSGQYKTLNITPVLKGQIVNHNRFTGEMEFQEASTGPEQIGYLLYFRLLNGYEKYFYMTRDEVTAHGKEYSASFKKGFGQWVENFEPMALKTVAKLGLSKYGVLSVEMQQAIKFDQGVVTEEGAEPKFVDAVDHEPEKPEAASSLPPAQSRLMGIIEAQEETRIKLPEPEVTNVVRDVPMEEVLP